MASIKYIGPLGDVEVFGRIVAPGESFDVADDQAQALLAQEGNFALADAGATDEQKGA